MSSLMQLLKARKKTNLSGERRSHNALCTIFLNGMLATVFAVVFPSGQAVAEGSATTSLSIKTTIGQGTCELTRNGALFSGLQVLPVPNALTTSHTRPFPLNLGLRCTGSALNLKRILLKISSPQIYQDSLGEIVIGTRRTGYIGSPYNDALKMSGDDIIVPGPGILLLTRRDNGQYVSIQSPNPYLLSEKTEDVVPDAKEKGVVYISWRSQERIDIKLSFIMVELSPYMRDITSDLNIGYSSEFGKLDIPGPWQGEVILDVIYE
ncbi:hypothetical protein H8467_003212 [Salmonella enterica]|nr:hypothetical protein [Salmonella enterica]